MAFWHLEGLSDEQLVCALRDLVRDKGRADALLVAHLALVEERRLHLKAACSSLFDYCRRRLGLSENEAFHRMTAARLARRFPLLFELLASRAITLSAVCLLRDYLTPENHVALLDAASRKSKHEVEALLAARFPAARTRASFRKLPSQKIRPLCAPPDPTASVSDAAALSEGLVLPPAPALAPNSASAAPFAVEPTPSSTALAAPARVGPTAGTVSPPVAAAPPPGPLPTAQPHFRLQLDVSARLKAKLEAAAALMSHSNPRGEWELTIERALDLLIAQLEKERWAKTSRPRALRLRRDEAQSKPTEAEEAAVENRGAGLNRPTETQASTATRPAGAGGRTPGAQPSSSTASKPRVRARIKNHVRRAIVERDGACCAYVSADGERCRERTFLQLHHLEPWARGGADSTENQQLLCAAHNRFFAEQDFGAAATARPAPARAVPQ